VGSAAPIPGPRGSGPASVRDEEVAERDEEHGTLHELEGVACDDDAPSAAERCGQRDTDEPIGPLRSEVKPDRARERAGETLANREVPPNRRNQVGASRSPRLAAAFPGATRRAH